LTVWATAMKQATEERAFSKRAGKTCFSDDRHAGA
jgi:hypothetical protein